RRRNRFPHTTALLFFRFHNASDLVGHISEMVSVLPVMAAVTVDHTRRVQANQTGLTGLTGFQRSENQSSSSRKSCLSAIRWCAMLGSNQRLLACEAGLAVQFAAPELT